MRTTLMTWSFWQIHPPRPNPCCLHVNADKTEFICFNQRGDIFTLNGRSLKIVDRFTYLENSVSSTKNDINTRLAKAWTTIDRRSVIWKSDPSDKIKRNFFQAVVVSILLYGFITWTLANYMEKKLDGNCTRMLRAVLNNSWRWHPTKQLYGYLPPISKTIQIRRTRHTGHWRSKDELIRDILLWTPSHRRTRVGRTAGTYIRQLCTDTGFNLEELPGAMNDRDEWWERVTAWWNIYIYIYIYIWNV